MKRSTKKNLIGIPILAALGIAAVALRPYVNNPFIKWGFMLVVLIIVIYLLPFMSDDKQ